MQVFKSYFKILNKKKGSMLMYVGIFAGIIFGFILPNAGKTEDEYKSMKCKFAWFDYDHTEESEELFSYLDHAHKHAELKTDTTEAMQDSLFNRNTDCIVRIKKGYADHLDKEDLSEYIEIVAIPNRSKVELFESDVNKYISYLNAYFTAGYDRAEAAAQVNELFQIRTNVTMTTEDHGGKHSTRYTFFSYLGWIFVVMMIEGVSPVLIVYDKKELRERIASSAYKYSNMTKEILLGTIVTGFLGCAVFAVGGCLVFRKEMFTAAGLGNLLNMVCYMFVAMALAFLASKIARNEEAFSMIGNIVSLGMAFLSGIFVPMEFLGAGVIKLAHFLPAYWYVKVVDLLDYEAKIPSEAFVYMGVEVLFAAAIITIAIVIDRARNHRLVA